MYKTFALILVFLVTMPLYCAAQDPHVDNSGYYNFFDAKTGFYIRMNDPKHVNITTNRLNRISFTILWYDKTNSAPKYDKQNKVNPNNIKVSYKNSSDTTVLTGNSEATYEILDYNTKLTNSKQGYKITIDIANKNPGLIHAKNYNGESGKIDVLFNYFNIDSPGSMYYTSFLPGTSMRFFDSVSFLFPKNSYLMDKNISSPILADQDINIEINERPSHSTDFIFASNSYSIANKHKSNDIQPSHQGSITLTYDKDIAQEVAMHNLSVAQYKWGVWVPIGGVIDSTRKTVTAPISEFGTYAAVLNYKTYNLESDWSTPYVLSLTHKGIIQPDLYKSDMELISNLSTPITRFQYVVLLARSVGLVPQSYNGYFYDVSDNDPDVHSVGHDATNYLMAAVSNGIVQGRVLGNGINTMDPNGKLSREEAAAFITRAMKLKINTYTDMTKMRADLSKIYEDHQSISDWAVPYVLAVTKAGILNGYNGHFHPKGSLTVKDASSILYKMVDKLKLFGK